MTTNGLPQINFTQVPDVFFDEIMADLKEGELRVLLYLMRHTYGWRKAYATISLSQLCDGMVREDGSRIDKGTGLSRKSVTVACQSLEDRGYIRSEKAFADNGACAPNNYQMMLLGENLVHHPQCTKDTVPPVYLVHPQDITTGEEVGTEVVSRNAVGVPTSEELETERPSGTVVPDVNDDCAQKKSRQLTPEQQAIQDAFNAFPVPGKATDPPGTPKRYSRLVQKIREHGLPLLREWTEWLKQHPQEVPEGSDPWQHFTVRFVDALDHAFVWRGRNGNGATAAPPSARSSTAASTADIPDYLAMAQQRTLRLKGRELDLAMEQIVSAAVKAKPMIDYMDAAYEWGEMLEGPAERTGTNSDRARWLRLRNHYIEIRTGEVNWLSSDREMEYQDTVAQYGPEAAMRRYHWEHAVGTFTPSEYALERWAALSDTARQQRLKMAEELY